MTLAQARQLKRGDRVIVLCSTEGAGADNAEHVWPENTPGIVDTVEQLSNRQGWAVHVTIGEGEGAILNVFDEADDGGRYPLAMVANSPARAGAFTFEAQGDETIIYATADDSCAALVRVIWNDKAETVESHWERVRVIVAALNAHAAKKA